MVFTIWACSFSWKVEPKMSCYHHHAWWLEWCWTAFCHIALLPNSAQEMRPHGLIAHQIFTSSSTSIQIHVQYTSNAVCLSQPSSSSSLLLSLVLPILKSLLQTFMTSYENMSSFNSSSSIFPMSNGCIFSESDAIVLLSLSEWLSEVFSKTNIEVCQPCCIYQSKIISLYEIFDNN